MMLVESKLVDPSERSSLQASFLSPFDDNMSMNIVPADVLLEIADYLSRPSEILHLYLTVRANTPRKRIN